MGKGKCEGRVLLTLLVVLQFIAAKTKAALDGGLGVILCIGETLEVRGIHSKPYEPDDRGGGKVLTGSCIQQREKNETISVVTHQLNAVAAKTKDWSKIVIAYEPVWCVPYNLPLVAVPAPPCTLFMLRFLNTSTSMSLLLIPNFFLGPSAPAKSPQRNKRRKSTQKSDHGSRRPCRRMPRRTHESSTVAPCLRRIVMTWQRSRISTDSWLVARA